MWNDNFNKIATKDINSGPYLRMNLLTSYDIMPWDLCRPQAPTVNYSKLKEEHKPRTVHAEIDASFFFVDNACKALNYPPLQSVLFCAAHAGD